MKRVIVTTGYQGWGNRKTGCEAYGPGGRWAGPIELPGRANENVVYGDLLGDHLDELGAHEGARFVVVALTDRHDKTNIDLLAAAVEEFVTEWVDRH